MGVFRFLFSALFYVTVNTKREKQRYFLGGRTLANINDVAKRANVSTMTVSRVINQSGYVKEETRQRVLKAMQEVNYVPNGLARSLVRQKTQTLALIVPDITNPFFTTIARGTEDMARKNGYRLILCNSDDDLAKEQEYIDMCLSIRVDGVIIAASGDQSKANLQKLKKMQIPFVCIDREIKGIQADIVKGDSVQGARKLVDHLISLGHKQIALISGPTTISTSRERLDGYREALEQHGIAYDPRYVKETPYNQATPANIVHDLLALSPRPTAIFAGNNFVAAHVIRALREQQIRVPEDIAVVGFDSVEPYEITEPFLTTAIQPAYNFGSLATQMLVERIDGAPVEKARKIVLTPAIAIRRSSGPPHGTTGQAP
jgi:LacI family transcriptional regulator